MKQILLCVVAALGMAMAAAAPGASPDVKAAPLPELKPAQQEARAARLAAEVLTRFHYKKMALDEALSAKIFDQYLKSLDSEKLFFVQGDVDRLAGDRTRLGDAIAKEDLSVPFAIFNLYGQRVAERFAFARTLLKGGFNFQENESYQFMRDKEAWPKSEAETRELWRKRVKNDWLRLKLAGKDDKNIAEILDKRYDNSIKRVGRLKGTDAFQSFMNAYTMSIEPHTNYMGPRAAEDFNISMRLSLVGIGAVLTELDEYTTIRELVPGGPASRSEQLKVGDRIFGVAQGVGAAMTDVLGWRLDDIVALIRGAEDSVVVLDVLPVDAGPDGKHRLVSLVRKKISLEQQAAKKSIHRIDDGKNTRLIGVISLPTFYEDFAGRQQARPDFRSATRDVARLLGELKKEKVDGVLVDLRDNGGGSLTEAIELTGLFIDKGPVVQQRNARGEISVGSDTQAGVSWDGPLGVLINRSSASASEIFAAAIQDYGRGLVIGEPSFGKGTVQTMIDLDQLVKNGTPQFGELKMTVAQFFRINGGTTQLRGVTPDILFPAIADTESFGESSFGNALPWTQIKAVDYAPAGDMRGLVPVLLKLHEARMKTDRDFQDLLEDIAEFKLQRNKNLLSLNEATRRKERDAQETRLKAREARRGNSLGASAHAGGAGTAPRNGGALRDDGLQVDERNLANQLAAEKARKGAKDVLLDAAVHIISDEVGALKAGASLAARVKPGSLVTTD
jgi:carboxyl-terminal processing protease